MLEEIFDKLEMPSYRFSRKTALFRETELHHQISIITPLRLISEIDKSILNNSMIFLRGLSSKLV